MRSCSWLIAKLYPKSINRHSSPSHIANFRASVDTIEEKYWQKQYRESLHLRALATKPEFRQKGIATALIEWGLQRSRTTGLIAGVESSEMAKGLYGKLGFQTIGYEELRDEMDAVQVKTWVMVWGADADREGRSWQGGHGIS